MNDVTPSSPIRVLLWSVKGSGLHYGGPGTNAFRLYRSAAPGRFDVTLAHGWPDQQPYDLFKAQHQVGTFSQSTLGQLRFVRDARRWMADHASEFDVFHGLQGFQATVSPALVAKRRGLPAVIKLAAHLTDLADKPQLRHRLLRVIHRRRRLVRRLDAIIAISRDIQQEMRSYGIPASQVVLIPNGVDADRFTPATPEERIAERDRLGWHQHPTLLYVGGLTDRKRPALMVKVLAELIRRGHDAQLIFAGPDSDPACAVTVRRLVDELNVSDRTRFLGHTEDVAAVYRASDVYALMSSNEGMPNALLEAMSSGLACIATNISGSRDLIEDDRNGRICEPELAPTTEAVAAYFDDPTLAAAHGAAARATVEQHYSTQHVLDQHERLFRLLMSGRSAGELHNT